MIVSRIEALLPIDGILICDQIFSINKLGNLSGTFSWKKKRDEKDNITILKIHMWRMIRYKKIKFFNKNLMFYTKTWMTCSNAWVSYELIHKESGVYGMIKDEIWHLLKAIMEWWLIFLRKLYNIYKHKDINFILFFYIF